MAKARARRVAPRSAPRASGARRDRKSPDRGNARWLIAATLAACALVAAGVLYTAVYLITPHRGRGVAVRVTLPGARESGAVALALYRAGIVERPWLFSWLLTLTGAVDGVPDEPISLRDDLTPRALLRALASGRGVLRVTVPEGFTRFEIAQRLAESGVIADANEFVRETESAPSRYGISAPSLEGYLYPDTYDLSPSMPAGDVAERMVRTFRRRWSELRTRHAAGFARAASLGLDERAVLTLASMIEKETGAPDDRARVSGVFWNRLTLPEFQPRLLQSDPTVVYGCRVAHPSRCVGATGTGRLAITRAMLDDASNAYNTYRREGLPPGPIANPGARAIEAALEPAATHDLYFVAMGNGRSAFATTRAEHEANVQRYLRTRPSDAGVR